MRLSVLPLFFLLAACSAELVDLPKPATISPPDPVKVAGRLKDFATQVKLQPPIEVSAPIEAPANNTDRWIICLRSGVSDESKRRTYSVFFKNDDLVTARLSAMMEPCSQQAFSELK
jgi:hypothetical protein